MNVSADIYKLLIKIFTLQLMETYRRGGCGASAVSTEHVCKHALGVRAPVNQLRGVPFPTFISRMELSLGSGGVSRSPRLA